MEMLHYVESRAEVERHEHSGLIERMKADACLANSIAARAGLIPDWIKLD